MSELEMKCLHSIGILDICEKVNFDIPNKFLCFF